MPDNTTTTSCSGIPDTSTAITVLMHEALTAMTDIEISTAQYKDALQRLTALLKERTE